MYAAGKIPGSFFKREGRAGEKGTLTARMIDRPIRPLFPKGWHFETQLVNMPLSVDHEPSLRRPRDERRLRGADALAGPARRARRRRAHRQGRRQLRRQPERGRPRRQHRPRPRRGRHRRGHPHGRGGRQRGLRGRDARRARHRPLGDQEALRAPARAGREGRQGEARRSRPPQIDEDLVAPDRREPRPRSSTRPPQVEDKLARQAATKAVEEAVLEQYSRRPRGRHVRRVPPARAARVRPPREDDHPRAHRQAEAPPGRSRRARDPADLDRGRRRAAHARLGALHPRPDAGAVRRRARHAEGGDAPRHPRARDAEVLLAPLQLPAVLGGRGRLHARPEAP